MTLSGGAAVAGWSASVRGDGQPLREADGVRTVARVGERFGLSQLGALEQAAAGASADHILMSYYPGAALGTIPRASIRVRLMSVDGETLDVYSDSGLQTAGRRVVAGQAAHLTPAPGGGADVSVTIGCAGDVLWR
jgi:hypothetical protein